ncbi:MAG TPA: GDSL-type esterase/lipase family protein [Puia sp.]|nr:GDSL-type esterase/lipase family protein [Puia sp.]
MNRRSAVFLAGLIMPLALCAQTIVGIGSSTISGEGADPGQSWLDLLQAYYTQSGLTVNIVNLGLSKSSSFNGMPSSYETPLMPGDPFDPSTPLYDHNITYAWNYHPDVVIIAYPSNDVVYGFTVAQWLSNLRTINDSVIAVGKSAWIATSQPRNDQPMSIRLLLKEARDSILAEFPGRALNFYDQLVDPATLGIQTSLTNDGIHPNDAGHALLFQVAKTANILNPTPLALSITGFGGSWNNGGIDLHWQITGTGLLSASSVERSGDGMHFNELWQESSLDQDLGNYSYTDQHPLSGNNFYRVKLNEQGAISYSPIISIGNPVRGWSIGELYSTGDGSQWNVVVNSADGGKVSLRIVDAGGKMILGQQAMMPASSQQFSLDLSPLAAGQYFLEVWTNRGRIATRAIQRF